MRDASNAGGEMATRTVARNRRNFRMRVVPELNTRQLQVEMGYLAQWIRRINQGEATVIRLAEAKAQLRALCNEADKHGIPVPWNRTTGKRQFRGQGA